MKNKQQIVEIGMSSVFLWLWKVQWKWERRAFLCNSMVSAERTYLRQSDKSGEHFVDCGAWNGRPRTGSSARLINDSALMFGRHYLFHGSDSRTVARKSSAAAHFYDFDRLFARQGNGFLYARRCRCDVPMNGGNCGMSAGREWEDKTETDRAIEKNAFQQNCFPKGKMQGFYLLFFICNFIVENKKKTEV